MWIKVGAASDVGQALIGAIYHPPRPLYTPQSLLDYIDESVEEIYTSYPGALVILAGDLNTLPSQDIIDRSGLSLLVDQPTRGESKLDRIYATDPSCYESTKILKSVVKSDHCAIIAYNGDKRIAREKTSTVCTYRRKSPTQHALFTEHARSEQYLPIAGNIQEAFDSFYNTALGQLDRFTQKRKSA
jgi:hypothetical protein